MLSTEKAELLKPTIERLYSKEGRSYSYISRLLDINRKTITNKIKEWKLPEAEHKRHLTPSCQKFLNKNRLLIKSRLDNNYAINSIAKELNISATSLLRTYIRCDNTLLQAYTEYKNRLADNHNQLMEKLKEKSCRGYNFSDIENEIWKPVLGYDKYFVSNKGRIKKYITRYKSYILISIQVNKNLGREYVCLQCKDKRQNLSVARLVAHSFVEGFSETNNTVNHIDGNPLNNCADNLEWVSQAQNNLHAYRVLNRNVVDHRTYNFKKIIYNKKYEFKTVTALSKFIGKSETQTRRYLDNPTIHNLVLVN